MGGPLNALLRHYASLLANQRPMMVEGTPKGEIMSVSRQQRAYVLNVAQQFLQSLGEINPLKDKKNFAEICGCGGDSYDHTGNFYRYFQPFARDYLLRNNFKPDKLCRLIMAGLGTSQASYVPRMTPLINVYGNTLHWWHDASGHDILGGFAKISLLGAAFDLCYAKHHQDGTRPL